MYLDLNLACKPNALSLDLTCNFSEETFASCGISCKSRPLTHWAFGGALSTGMYEILRLSMISWEEVNLFK